MEKNKQRGREEKGDNKNAMERKKSNREGTGREMGENDNGKERKKKKREGRKEKVSRVESR